MSFLTEIMKRIFSNRGRALGWVICLFCLAGPGYCENGTALMLEVSPVNGGTLNLSPGVHNYDRDAAVTLTAVPKSGYQFVYWVGSVDNATTSTTMVFLDSPKIVIAVFERSKFDLVDLEGPDISGGGGRLIPSGPDYAAGLEQAGGGRRPPSFHRPRPPEPGDDFPVPESGNDVPVPEGDDFPVPVPEPATICLLGIGGLILLRKRHKELISKRK